jgi:hypothetical protein
MNEQYLVKLGADGTPVSGRILGCNFRDITPEFNVQPLRWYTLQEAQRHGYGIVVLTEFPRIYDDILEYVIEENPVKQNQYGEWLQNWVIKDIVFETEEAQSAATQASVTRKNNNIKSQINEMVDTILRGQAIGKGYDSIVSAVSYAEESSVPSFQADGIAFREWRSKVWESAIIIIDEVLADTREIPTKDELVELLPKLTLV